MPSALHRAVIPEQGRKWQGSEKGDKRGEPANAEPYQQSNGASGLCSCLSRRRTAPGAGWGGGRVRVLLGPGVV